MSIDTKKKSPEDLAGELTAKIEKNQQDVLSKCDDALTAAQKAGEMTSEVKGKLDETLTGQNALREHLKQVEQKIASKQGTPARAESYGRQVATSEKFAQFKARGYDGSVRFSLKAITSTDAAVQPDRDFATTVGLPKREFTIRDLMTVVPTDSGSVDYMRQNVRTNAAAPVAEGAAKPESTYGWELINLPMRTIAHITKMTRQAIEDQRQLEGEVEMEMRYGLGLEEETQILTGDGTGQNLTGLVPNATAFVAPFTIDEPTKVDILRLAMVQSELALYPADGHVLNPADWGQIELTKTSEGAYVFAQPQGLAGPRMWGLPVVSTVAMTAGDFLTGGFRLQTLYDRMAPEVLIASENSDDFEKNMYTMRCEERAGVAIKRPAALYTGDFDAAITAATSV